MARSTPVQRQMFLKIHAQFIELKTPTFSSSLGTPPILRRLFYPVYDRNMTNFKYSFDTPKAISFQIYLYRFSLDMFWVAALSYRVVASTFSLHKKLCFWLLNPLFTRFLFTHFEQLIFLLIHYYFTRYIEFLQCRDTVKKYEKVDVLELDELCVNKKTSGVRRTIILHGLSFKYFL